MTVDRSEAQELIQLAELALRFSRVERVTYHPDGRRHETDSDHTVVLALTALPFAAKFLPELDLGLVAQFCLVHDLPEAYAGDTDSFKADDHERASKIMREHAAVRRISMETEASFPWVADMLRRYEAQQEPAARYVWAFDKIQPILTHILNGGTYLLKDAKATRHDLAKFNAAETTRVHERAGDMVPMMELYGIMKGLLFEYVYGI